MGVIRRELGLILKLTLKLKPLSLCRLQRSETNHYATLGLDRLCTPAQIRAAYRVLARQHHPDLNPDSPAAVKRTQELNVAYEILSDAGKRAVHDRELETPGQKSPARREAKTNRNVSQDLSLRLEEFFRGATRSVTVHDPANPGGQETYELIVPPETAPGTKFRVPRDGLFAGGFVQVRVKAQPAFQFKVRGCDLRCDLKIKPERAAQGGMEMIRGVTGNSVRVAIPRGVGRGEIIRISGEGLPKPRGGRGDLLVRITYRVEVRFARASAH
jgi:curved DNA-binding protein